MTRQDLINELTSRIGLELVDNPERNDELIAMSPNGAQLFTVQVFGNDERGWQFGGCGSLLQVWGNPLWGELCRLGDEDRAKVEALLKKKG